jgi:hypothetical protein
MSVRRWDVFQMDAPTRTPQGFLRVPARISRTGVQYYADGKGGVLAEYRPPEEVFSSDALGSFAMVPLTLRHPPEPVTKDNVSKFRVGTVGDPRKDGIYVSALIQIEDAKAIDAVEKDGLRELSCGYLCDLEMTPGVAPDGVKYDVIQRSIRGNHVAVLEKGRAGPEVRLRMDTTDAAQVDPAPSSNGVKVTKVKIDGYEFDVDERAASAIEKERLAVNEKLKTAIEATMKMEKERDAAVAKADASEEKVKELEKKADPKVIAASVSARVALEKSAAHLAPTIKVDGLDDLSLKRSVLEKLGIKTDGKSDSYIEARFDISLEEASRKNPAASARGVVEEDVKIDEAVLKTDADAAHKALKNRSRKAHLEPIPGAAVAK